MNRAGRKRRAAGRKGPLKKDLRQFIPIAAFAAVILFFIILRALLSNGTEDYFEYYSIDREGLPIAAGDEITDYEAREDSNDFYFSFSFIKEYIDPYIFYDEDEKKITVTTADKVIRMVNEELEYYVNNEPLTLDMPFYTDNNEPYVPLKLLSELYSVNAEKSEESGIVILDFGTDYYTAQALKNTRIRFKAEKDSLAAKQTLKKGSSVYVYPDKSDGDFCKIRTSLGYIGYVPKKALSEPILKKVEIPQNTETAEKNIIEGKINLVFDQVTVYTANNRFEEPVPEGVNVVCPTWFSFEDTECTMRCLADKAYVDAVHENGAQVWGLITDNFTQSISQSIISTSSSREKVIKQLLAYTSLYELDGINIDFEAVPKDMGDCYIQFLRELAPLLRQQGAVLSVDMFVPKSWTEHYNRAEAAKTADYIIVMGYDEHYSGGGTSGSVASIGWSKEAITATLAQDVPEEKLILGIPFYTRLWKEEAGDSGLSVTASAYGMDDAREIAEEKGGEIQWLEDIGQYYTQYEEDGAVYKLWLEDERSIRQRIQLVNEYGIAGCAAWKRGFESSGIWSAINEELNGG